MILFLALLAVAPLQDAPPSDDPPATTVAPITPGTIAVKTPPAPSRGPSPYQPYAEAVGDAFVDAGFTPIPGVEHARYVASVEVLQEGKGAVRSKAPVDGPNAILAARAVSIGLPTGKSNVGELVQTELAVRITERGHEEVLWEGHAVTHQVDGTANGSPQAVATKLASALLRNFPQPSGLRISVP